MPDSILNDLSTALDLVVLEALPTAGFRRIEYSHVPDWFVAAFHDAGGRNPVALEQAFPVLQGFLREANAVWLAGSDARRDSEPFVITDSTGHEVPVIATALAIRGRQYLLIQHDAGYQTRQRILQAARDHALEHERTLTRLHALRKPIAALLRIAEDPGLASDVSAVAASLRDHAAALRAVLDDLPAVAAKPR
jgi:hypothetical protein